MMMTAEKWHDYQRGYKKYGFDMKPPAPAAEKPAERKKTGDKASLSEKAKTVLFILLCGALVLCFIVSSAYRASVQYEINIVGKENAALVGEIENLNVKIKNATSIRTIEEKALNELGMVYPSSEQFVFLTRQTKPQGEFAMLLMEHAYN